MRRLVLLAPLLMLVAAGCGSDDEIRAYTVPKTAASSPAQIASGQPSRILGAMTVHDGKTWFFKINGKPELVAAASEAFRAFLDSLRFENTDPVWDLPEGWSQQPSAGSAMRFATLNIATAAEALTMSVIGLPTMGDESGWLLSNLNRWRSQVQEAPADSLSNLEKIELSGGPAYLVDVTGTASGGASMGGAPFAPFAGGMPGQSPPAERPRQPAGPSAMPPASAGKTAGKPPFTYDTPKTWAEDANNSMSVAAFRATDGQASCQVTVTPLPAAAADVVANVNRWRRQIGLEAVSGESIRESTEIIPAGDKEASCFVLAGKPESIIGAIAIRDATAWFIKMKGDSALVLRENARFREFVKSLSFE